MGQQASLLEDKTFETQAISFQRDKVSFARKNPSFMESIESQDSCMNYFCSFHPKQPEKWKVEALKHLKSLKSQYWPELLIKILKQTTNEKLDLIYKADMYYMINKSNLSALSPIKESSPSFKDSFKSSRPDIKFSTSQVPVSLYTGGSRGPEQFNLPRSEPFDEPKEKNTLIIKEENLAEKSSKIEHSNSILPLDSSAGDNVHRDTIKNSFSSHVIRIGKTSTKIQLMDKQYQPSGQIYSIRETDVDFVSNNGCKLKFDLAICILEKHFADRRNIFHKLIAAFQAYLIERFQKPETKFGFREIEEVYNWAVDDIKQFVVILYESVKFYYSFIRIKRQHVQEYDSIFSKSNFINALTSMVFNKETHSLMIQLCRIRTAKIEEFCMRSFKVWKNLDPQQFGVHNKYALNQGTIDHMKKEDSVTFGQDDTIIKDEEIDSGIKFNLKENSIGETSIHAKIPPALDNSSPSEHSFNPYEKAAVEICLLRNKTSPGEKYKIILRVGELVTRAIRDFYKGSKDKLDSNLSVNELLPIVFYIIVKSESYDIFTHGQLVASFVPKDMLVTPGYEYVKIIETIENFMYTKTLRNSYNIETVGINLQDFLRSSLLKVDASICQDILNEKLEEKRKVSN